MTCALLRLYKAESARISVCLLRVGWRRQVCADQRLHVIPNLRIAFYLGVRFGEVAVPPRIVFVAIHWVGCVIETKVSDNVRAGRICRVNFGASMRGSIGLIKIGSLSHVRRNNAIILSKLPDAIDLDGQKHWNAIGIQFARQVDGFRTSPAVAVENDAGILFFFCCQPSFMVSIQELQDFLISALSAVILKNLDVNAGRIFTAKARGELDLGVNGIVAADKSSHESDHDGRRSSGIHSRYNSLCRRDCGPEGNDGPQR